VTERWNVAIDRGGTFTDLVARSSEGRLVRSKSLSRPGQEAAAIAALLKAEGGVLEDLRVGTTVATNALLTGKGARVGLLVTQGLGDCLIIGDQRRPDLFDLNIVRCPPLYEEVVPIHQRMLADGEVRRDLDEEEVRATLAALRTGGITVVVVAFVHSHLHPEHELAVERIAAGLGFDAVILSHRSSPGLGFLERCETAVAEGLISGPLGDYRLSLNASLPANTSIEFMKSSGGLSPASSFRGIDSVLSGPAGGAVACGRLARSLGLPAVLGFDMGGTSTDVSRWSGEVPLRQKVRVAGRDLRVPCVDIVTVAAGGGSLLSVEDGRAQVGPDSAGASPGPACYGQGGPATLTDANVILGRLQPDQVPAVFGPEGGRVLDREAARVAGKKLGGLDLEQAAAGFLAVANARMAAATSELCLARGADPSKHSLIAFGGASGQHACAVAARLGITHVLLPVDASVFSAAGIGLAPSSALRSAAVLEVWDDSLPARWATRTEALANAARQELGLPGLSATVSWSLRYVGSKETIAASSKEDFEVKHEARLGFRRPGRAVEAVAVEVRVSTSDESAPASVPKGPSQSNALAAPFDVRPVGFSDVHGNLRWLDTPLFERSGLLAGQGGEGPAMIVDPLTTVVVDPGWSFALGPGGHIELQRSTEGLACVAEGDDSPSAPSPQVLLELYFARFTSIASRMGDALRRVAWSVNIKERLDFSCALFDRSGNLVTNAPHIPVHLGAMGETVRALKARLGAELQPGRSWAINDPYAGGSHLPDITVITPLFDEGQLFAWLANRGHHSDVGGMAPGSMPPFSRSLDEEGVLLRDLLLVDSGLFREGFVRQALAASDWPCRDPDTVVGDLEAQVAANAVGLRELRSLIDEEGSAAVTSWMDRIQDNGDAVVRCWIENLDGAVMCFEDSMDDGTVIRVELRAQRDSAGEPLLVVDFAGSGPASALNLNAPPPISRAAFLYVLRSVIGRDIPLNEGCLRRVELRLPRGSILDPPAGAAVVGGNVETSQRIVDVLLGALGVAAASQGTMNNFSFGNEDFGYYETIAGGAGGTPQAAGCSGVHTHMTNTRITDVEVLETRYPVLLHQFAVRSRSGGEGRNPGGDGLVREIEFLDPLEVSLLAQRRGPAPFGLEGGGAGAIGETLLRRAGSEVESLMDGSFSLALGAGDVLKILTPGGGGWGQAPS
jgi:5-oxoprolinase (ATP-hydrolysing)